MELFSAETLAHYGLARDSNGELVHFGIPGMKWGQRKSSGSSARHPSYDNQQHKRDVQVYGRRGANRINKSLNKGDRISVARGAEKTRRDRVMGKNKYVRQGGKVAGALAGLVGGNLALSGLSRAVNTTVGRTVVSRIFGSGAGSKVAITISTLASNPVARLAVSAGAAQVGTMLAGDAAVSANMRLNGYDPSRK